jgi:hypothetical protein
MADASTPSTPPSARGRGRGRGSGQRAPRGGNSGTDNAEQDNPAFGRGGRQRGRGRGGRGRGGASTPAREEESSATQNLRDAQGGGKVSSSNAEEERKGKKPISGEAEAEEEEGEVCFICASPVIHQALSPCNHRTCHICALRLRALYKTKACAHCRVSFRAIHIVCCGLANMM